MAGEGLVLHLGVDGTAAKQEAGKLVKELQGMFAGVKVDLSGKNFVRSGGRSGVKGQGRKIVQEVKEEVEIITNGVARTIKVSQAMLKRLQDKARVDDLRNKASTARGVSIDPSLPFLNPGFSGRGLSGRNKVAYKQWETKQNNDRRELEGILKQKADYERRNESKDKTTRNRNILSAQGLARQREREREKDEKETGRENKKYMRSSASLARQRTAEEESAKQDEQTTRNRNILSAQGLARQRAKEDEQTAKRVESTNRQLNSMISNPNAANYTVEGLKQRAQYAKDNIQGPRFARQQAAQRSQDLAFAARHGRGPDQKAIAGMFGRAGVYRADDMRRQNQRGHRGNMAGMGFYQAQQMFEDYQYAGVRGMGNNLAFMGASVGGSAGMGIIGAALALQIGELTYKMLGYADAEEKATKKAEQLAKSQLALIEVGHDVAVSFAAGEAASRERYKDLTENPEKKNAREKHVLALQQLDQLDKADPASVIQSDVMKNPEKYLKYSTGRSGSVEGSMKAVEESKKEKSAADKAIKLLDQAQAMEAEYSRMAFDAEGGYVERDDLAKYGELADKAMSDYKSHVSSNYPDLSGNLPKAGEFISGDLGGDSTNTGIIRTALQKLQSQTADTLRDKTKENEDNKARMKSPEGSRHVAESALSQMFEGDRATQEILQPILETDAKLNSLVSERVKSNEELAKSEERIADKKQVLAEQSERIRDAEQDTDRIMKSQLSTAEDMVDSYRRKVATFKDGSISSRDSFNSKMFGINRERTAGFLEKAGASPAYIQQRDDMIVQSRLQQLRGSATSAGKAGDTDRQIEMLKELQNLQMDMAGSDSRFGVANGFFNAASGTQKEIEAAYQTQVNAATSQQQAWQGVVNSLKDAEKIKIDPMSPDAFPKLQQYLAMLQAAQAAMGALNPGMAAGSAPLFAPAQDSMLQANPDFQQANYDLFGAPHARGGLIGGMGRNDTVNARLMPHEYVIRADVVKRLGAATFEGINRTGTLPRMAGGGMFNGDDGVMAPDNLSNAEKREWYRRAAHDQRLFNRRDQEAGKDRILAKQGFVKFNQVHYYDPYTENGKSHEIERAKVEAEHQAMRDMQMARENRKADIARRRSMLAAGSSKSPSTSSSAPGLAQAKYDLFGNNYSVRRPRRNRGGSGGGYGGYGSSNFGGSGGRWFGGSGGPNDVYGEVLSAIAPGFSGGLGNIGGFSNRLLGGNYSGGNFSRSWWGSLASERFGRLGPNFGIRGAAGGVREETQKWRGGRHGGGFHAFASGGMVQPFASSSYQPAIQAIVQGLTGGGSGSSRSGSSTVNNNRSNIGAININVTGSGTAGLAIDQARRSQHAARLRKG